MPRNYRHIKQYEKEIMEMKAQGSTQSEIGDPFFVLSVHIGAVQYFAPVFFIQGLLRLDRRFPRRSFDVTPGDNSVLHRRVFQVSYFEIISGIEETVSDAIIETEPYFLSADSPAFPLTYAAAAAASVRSSVYEHTAEATPERTSPLPAVAIPGHPASTI